MKRLLLVICGLFVLCSCGVFQHAVRVPADMDLVGYYHRPPHIWDADRLAPHVSFIDAEGKEQWLFESFLFIEASDGKRHLTMSIAPSGHSARRESWEDQLSLWLGPEGGVANLEKACADAASRIGKPERKRQVIITIPDAIMFEHFANKQSSTKYWGEIDGRELDFADVNDQLAALYWYIDQARAMFASLKCKYLELGGFYIVSEDLPVAYGETEQESFNAKYKRWETIVPALSAYCHKKGEGLYWVPYHMAAGYRFWKKLGFDMAWMQPNYYWDLKSPGRHPFDKTLAAIKDYGMGMELEFEYSLVSDVMKEVKQGPDGAGKMIFGEEDVPALKEQFRDYMRKFKEAGLYGKASIALYSGSNALTQLATSTSPEDKELYLELCNFVVNNPLRH